MSGPQRRGPRSPDCAAGKHAACTGDAWDDLDDQICRCYCTCHRPPIEAEEQQ